MELALHLRSAPEKDPSDRFPEHLLRLYQGTSFEQYLAKMPRSFDRIYIGDEFCPHRLPSPSDLDAFLEFAEGRSSKITLLTPVLTDEGMERCSPLFDHLDRNGPRSEVVVNDWGVLLFLKERYPHFRLSAGRVLNKGLKDPRLPENDNIRLFSPEVADFLSDSTFEHREFREKMAEWGVSRLERDVHPFGSFPTNGFPPLSLSVYFPFGYVTTGRVCWPASFAQSPRKRFALSHGCSRPCDALPLELEAADISFRIVQSGNTLFYLYTPAMLITLIGNAGPTNLRLVYQGFALWTP